jgi:hypothetical protein
MRTLANACSHLLLHHLPLEARNQLWLGLWRPHQRLLLQTSLETCNYHDSHLVLKGMGTYAATIVRDLWLLHQHLLKDLSANEPDTPHPLHAPDPPTASPPPPDPPALLPPPPRHGTKRPPTRPPAPTQGSPPRKQQVSTHYSLQATLRPRAPQTGDTPHYPPTRSLSLDSLSSRTRSDSTYSQSSTASSDSNASLSTPHPNLHPDYSTVDPPPMQPVSMQPPAAYRPARPPCLPWDPRLGQDNG